MEENKFVLTGLALILTCMLGIVVTIGACDAYSNYTMLQMVKSGVDPIKARCSIVSSKERNSDICMLAAQGKQ